MQDDIKPAPTTNEGMPAAPTPEPAASSAAPAAAEQPAPAEPIAANEPALAAAPASTGPTPPLGITDAPTDMAPATPTVSPAPPQPGRTGKKLLVGLLLIVLLAAAGGLAWYSLHKQKQSAATATNTKHDIPVINYGVVGTSVDSLYPLTTNTAWATQVDSQIFEGLVGYQDETRIVPLLATGWTNPDTTHWVFTIRQNVQFHNGHPLTAQAVKASLDYAVAHQGDSDGSLVVSLASTIKSVSVNGDKVTITTDGPDPTLLNRLAALEIFDPAAAPGDAAGGTGPYQLKPGQDLAKSSTVDLVAVPNYWGGHVYTRAIHMVSMSDADQLAKQTAAGKFDVAGSFSADQIATAHGTGTVSVADFGVNFIGLNTLKATSPLHSLAARQAAAYAIDVPTLLKATGIDSQATQLSQLLPPAIPGYDANLPLTQHDTTKAKQLLASVPNAKAPLTFSYPQADEQYANELIRQLTAVGFNIQPQSVASLDDLVGIALGGKTDLFYLGYSSDTLDGLDVLSTILIGTKDYDNPTIDSLAQQASTTLDPTTRIGLLQKISKQAAADVPDIPLFTQSRVYVLRHPDYHIKTDLANAAVGALFWKVYQQ